MAFTCRQAPLVQAGADLRCSVTGLFYRAVDPAHRGQALAGSRLAGRYSHADQPTLYLSSSPEGVTAAMASHVSVSTRLGPGVAV